MLLCIPLHVAGEGQGPFRCFPCYSHALTYRVPSVVQVEAHGQVLLMLVRNVQMGWTALHEAVKARTRQCIQPSQVKGAYVDAKGFVTTENPKQ